jgi:hypothetical protein
VSTIYFNIKKLLIHPKNVFMGFIRFSAQMAITSLNSIEWFILVVVTWCATFFFYRVRQANPLFCTDSAIWKRGLAFRTLYNRSLFAICTKYNEQMGGNRNKRGGRELSSARPYGGGARPGMVTGKSYKLNLRTRITTTTITMRSS